MSLQHPEVPPQVNSACILKGKASKPKFEGGSRTVHYEIRGTGDAHPVVFILTIDLSSH